MKQYIIKGQAGQRDTATSLRAAKRAAKRMCSRNVGATSNMMFSGAILPAPRLYWQTWCDGTIIGDSQRGYAGDNPLVSIRETAE